MAEPAEKKPKTDDTPEAEAAKADDAPKEPEKTEEPTKEPEPVKELEEDAKKDTRPAIKESVTFLTPDTTLNVLPSTVGNMLMCLTDGGFQYLVAGARASVGVKAGRYMFEVKLVEHIAPSGGPDRSQGQRHLVKVGLSTAGSSLFLGDSEENVCFDSEGLYTHNKVVSKCSQKFSRDDIVCVLVNLDDKSPNFNTVSLFKDGVRASPPQKLPETLHGKVLYPSVSFKNATVHVNFGPAAITPLPFTCKMWQEAAQKDTSVTKFDTPKDGKYEVLFPVCLPDEGTFDWLDLYLEKNPHFTEISDRAILQWAEKSGVARPKGYHTVTSHDKPDFGFGIPQLDDLSVRKILQQVAPMQPRNFIVMEVRGNLLKEERALALPCWNVPTFKKIAMLLIGEPSLDFKKKTQEYLLKAKQEASDAAFRFKKAEEKRQKELAKKRRAIEREKKKAEKAKAKQMREIKKKAEAEKKRVLEEQAKREAEAKKKAEEEEEARKWQEAFR
mmetsp:Transcript_28432/g.52165  ORF Transcript_28432/g.52165 Transcript_28432/m.52165 type:complete len:499 (-) Transcript_28432:70-1566(-)